MHLHRCCIPVIATVSWRSIRQRRWLSSTALDPRLAAFNDTAPPSVVATRIEGRGRALRTTHPVAANSNIFADAPPLIAVTSLEQNASLCSGCFCALPTTTSGARVSCACGYHYCSQACLSAAQAGGHSAICGHTSELDAWCTSHGLNFPRVAAAMLGRSLAGENVDFMTYWSAVQNLIMLPVPGSSDELPPHWLEGYTRVRDAVSRSMEGDTAVFWASCFDERTYARLMGTLRLNSFSVVAPNQGVDPLAGGSTSLTSLGWDAAAISTARDSSPEPEPSSAPLFAAAAAPATADASPPVDGARCGGADASIDSCSSEGACSSSHFKEAGGGSALFALASLLNHSCDPNCEVVMHPFAHVVVRAKRDLPAGAELTTSYVDTALGAGMRQARLLHGYGFACQCERCKAETQPTSRMRGSTA